MQIIKRYSNRKLYDTSAKRYITLEGIADLIRRGEEVRVTDHESGQDITAMIQAQTIFELEKKLKGVLPGAVLTNLIRAGSDTLSQLRDVLTPNESRLRMNDEIERRIQSLVSGGQLAAQEGSRMLELLIVAGETTDSNQPIEDSELARALKERGIPSRQDWESLMQRLDALNTELEHLEPLPPQKRQAPRTSRKKTRRE